MPDNRLNLAKLLLQGLIPPEKFADHMSLAGQNRHDFIEYIQNQQKNFTLSTGKEEQILSEVKDKIESVTPKTEKEKRVFNTSDFLKKRLEQGKDLPSPVMKLASPTLLMASTYIGLAKKSRNANMADYIGATSATLSSTNVILNQTVLANAEKLLSASSSFGVASAVGLLKELKYQYSHQKMEEKVNQTLKSAEESYLDLHKTYAEVAKHYQFELDILKEDGPESSAQYQQTIEEWLSIERFFHEKIEESQNAIATVSSMSQELQSKRRLDRANDVLNSGLHLTALAGPPGLIASTIVKAVASAGTVIGEHAIEDSARLNHGVVEKMSDMILISDPNDIQDTQNKLQQIQQPTLAISGPILKPSTTFGFDTDNMRYSDSQLAAKMASKAAGHISCSFSFSKPLPSLFDVKEAENGQSFSNDPALKKEGKEQLKLLAKAQQDLTRQASYLRSFVQKLMDKEPHPYVINYKELKQALDESNDAINARKALIEKNMGRDYLGQDNAGTKLLEELSERQTAYQNEMNDLLFFDDHIDNTPCVAIFSMQQASGQDSNSLRDAARKILSEQPLVRQAWFKELQFKTDSVMQVSQMCAKMGKGRHIQNLNQAIQDIQQQVVLAHQVFENPNAKLVTNEDKESLNDCMGKLRDLRHISAELDQSRMTYLTAHKGQLVSTQSHYQELIDYRDRLLDSVENGHISSVVSAATIEQMQQDLNPSLLQELQNISPVKLATLAQTDAIVSPNRTFFGLTKHQDMQGSIQEKIESLQKDNPIIDTIQVMPLRAIDDKTLSACAGDFTLFKNVIEGVKTEIQWVNKFMEACQEQVPPITVSNQDTLSQYYQKQIEILDKVCKNKSDMLENKAESTSTLSSIKAYKTALRNTVHEAVFHDAETELQKAHAHLEKLQHHQENKLNVPTLDTPEQVDQAASIMKRFKQNLPVRPNPSEKEDLKENNNPHFDPSL